jgi:hypothetical protein
MKAFDVRVRTHSKTITYTAIGPSSADVHMSALDLFGICSVAVIPR